LLRVCYCEGLQKRISGSAAAEIGSGAAAERRSGGAAELFS